jgi:hypothetical protein
MAEKSGTRRTRRGAKDLPRKLALKDHEQIIPGTHNHCAICGHIAVVHVEDGEVIGPFTKEVKPHAFQMREDEGIRPSEAPTWGDFEDLRRRVEELEAGDG